MDLTQEWHPDGVANMAQLTTGCRTAGCMAMGCSTSMKLAINGDGSGAWPAGCLPTQGMVRVNSTGPSSSDTEATLITLTPQHHTDNRVTETTWSMQPTECKQSLILPG